MSMTKAEIRNLSIVRYSKIIGKNTANFTISNMLGYVDWIGGGKKKKKKAGLKKKVSKYKRLRKSDA